MCRTKITLENGAGFIWTCCVVFVKSEYISARLWYASIGVFGIEGRHVSTYLMTWRRLVVVVENDEFVLRDEIVDVMWYGW